jgi:hypothetical protein
MIEPRGFVSRGIGLTDAHLVASCLSTLGVRLWTVAGKLGKVADALSIRSSFP